MPSIAEQYLSNITNSDEAFQSYMIIAIIFIILVIFIAYMIYMLDKIHLQIVWPFIALQSYWLLKIALKKNYFSLK